MKWFTNILILVLYVCPGLVQGQTYFNKRFPPEPGSWGSGTRSIGVVDSTYFANRWSASTVTGMLNHDLCEINNTGDNVVIKDTYSDTLGVVFGQLLVTRNKGFVEVVSFDDFLEKEQFYGVFRYDDSGFRTSTIIDSSRFSHLWMKQVVELINGDLIIVGTINYSLASIQTRQLVVIKTDSLGHQIWKKTFRLTNNSWRGECIALAHDGGFFIGGAEVNYNLQNSFTRSLVMKLDSNGNRQWHRFFGNTDHSNAPVYGITPTPNGGCAFAGGVGLPDLFPGVDGSGLSPWVVGLDDFGRIIWADTNTPEQASYGVENYYTDIESLPDGSFVVTGQRDIWDGANTGPDKTRMHGVIAKYSNVGEPQWVRNYRHPEVPDEGFPNHLLFDIDPTPDGGFVAAGYLNPSFDNSQDTWVIKVDSFGCLVKGCEVTSVPKIETSISSLHIYPNPASEVVHFDITPNTLNAPIERSRNSASNQTFELKLYDITGKLVLTQTLINNENSINVTHLKPGVYNYRLNETWGSLVVE